MPGVLRELADPGSCHQALEIERNFYYTKEKEAGSSKNM